MSSDVFVAHRSLFLSERGELMEMGSKKCKRAAGNQLRADCHGNAVSAEGSMWKISKRPWTLSQTKLGVSLDDSTCFNDAHFRTHAGRHSSRSHMACAILESMGGRRTHRKWTSPFQVHQ